MTIANEAATLFLNGEPHTARLILRDLVNATVGDFTVSRLRISSGCRYCGCVVRRGPMR